MVFSMECSTLISCLSLFPASNIEIAGILINGVLMLANICFLVVMIKTYRKQSKQITESTAQFQKQFEENKRQFSDRSFQDAFFGLFRFLNEEKELYEYSEETEYEKIQDGSLYVQIRDLIREKLSINTAGFIVEIQNYQPGVKDPMPLVKSILLLIHKNVEDGSISQDSAMFYAGLVASKLNVFAVREYRLLCVRGYTKSGSREDYDTANQLGIFKILDEPYDIPEIDEIDKQIQEHIINVIEGRTSFKPSNPNWG